MYKAIVIADSVTVNGARLTTMELTFPRIILAEMNTHRALSKNTASSRAIPYQKIREAVRENPYIPRWTGAQKGMQGKADAFEEWKEKALNDASLAGLNHAVQAADYLFESGVHKQDVNRYLEPWMWVTQIATATDWTNFFTLRNHPDAHPAMQTIAKMAQEARKDSIPILRKNQADIHAPYVDFNERLRMHEVFGIAWKNQAIASSVARCARISYVKHGEVREWEEERAFHDKLINQRPMHASPLEHQAWPMESVGFSGNFYGWTQYRQTLSGNVVKEPFYEGPTKSEEE